MRIFAPPRARYVRAVVARSAHTVTGACQSKGQPESEATHTLTLEDSRRKQIPALHSQGGSPEGDLGLANALAS